MFMVNLGCPEEEAVNISPTPELSTTNVAKDVLPDMEATARVPEEYLTSKVVRGVVVPIPIHALSVAELIPFIDPKTKELDWSTLANAPKAVALYKCPAPTSAFLPKALLLYPVKLLKRLL